MLLELGNWTKGYNQILADCRPQHHMTGNSGTVLILCHPDTDATCAGRMLTYMLRADNIPYQIQPCGGIRRLISILESLNLYSSDEDDDIAGLDENEISNISGLSHCSIRSIVLLNFGATVNLNTMLYSPRHATSPSSSKNNIGDAFDGQDEEEEDNINSEETFLPPLVSSFIKTFIFDSHRPYHLANVHAGKNVVMFNDYDKWHDDDGGIPSDGDGLSGDEEDEEDESEDEEDDEDNDPSDEEGDSDGEAEFEDEDDHKLEFGDIPDDMSQGKSFKRTISQRMEVDDDDDDDGDDEKSPVRTKRQRQDDPDTPATAQMMTDDENSQGNSVDTIIHNDSPKAGVDDIQSIREQHEIRRQKIRNYYGKGTFFSSPVAIMVYDLLTQLRHTANGDMCWLSCVGLTDSYIHNRIDLSGFIKCSMKLQSWIRDIYTESDIIFNGNDDSDMQIMNRRVNNSIYAEDLYGGSSNDQSDFESSSNQRSNGTIVSFSDNGRILVAKDEFRFFLLRHVSLWDAMVLSPEVNTKMELWKNNGRKKLKEMLAKMGLPLVQCQQPYAFMKPGLKRRLKQMISEHAHDYGLDNLSYTGFIRVTGYKSLLSASDVAYAITALLDCENKTHSQRDGEDQNMNTAEEEELALVHSFNAAYDALNSNGSSSGSVISGRMGSSMASAEGTDISTIVNGGSMGGNISGIGAGIRQAVALQKSIVSTAMLLVERKSITRLSHFRYAYLNATSNAGNGGTNLQSKASISNGQTTQKYSHHVFAKPLALTKLALFLMDMHRYNKKWTGSKARPLILLAEKPQTQTYLIVGFDFAEEKGSLCKNQFKQKFKLVTDTMKGSFKYDSFESNVIEVKASDAQKFIEHLHYMMDSI